jgi:hypothetical protein
MVFKINSFRPILVASICLIMSILALSTDRSQAAYHELDLVSQDVTLFNLDQSVAEGQFMITTTCIDSDGGLIYNIAGYVEGLNSKSYPYKKYDVCESGDLTGYLREYYCSGVEPRPKYFRCPYGCSAGACNAESCTDVDQDTYAIEGGNCGEIDCDDTNPDVHPGATEVCNNGVDDDCDDLIDQADPECLICTDNDEDGYAAEGGACGPADCNDNDSDIHPGVLEVCGNGVDDDCDGLMDDQEPRCGGGIPNIIVIGWDGVQRDHIIQCYNKQLPECPNGLPNLAALTNNTLFNNTSTNAATATKPGWSQILSGYGAEVTGIYDLKVYQPIPEGYTVFEKIEIYFGPENIVTMFISAKGVHTGGACVGDPTTCNGQPCIEQLGQPFCYTKFHLDYFELNKIQNSDIGNRALQLLDLHQNDLFFALFLFRDPDVTGHIENENAVKYSEKLIELDTWLGQIMTRVQQLGIADETLIYITSDHGFDEGKSVHLNAPYSFLATNDPLVMRSGDRKDPAATFLERYGIDPTFGDTPPLNAYSLYSIPPLGCIPEGQAFLDYPGAPACCAGLTLIDLDIKFGACLAPTGGTGDSSGYCTACGNGVCASPENRCNCPQDCY